MKRILLLGCTGQLGWELQRTLSTCAPLIRLDYPEIDFSQPDSLRDIVHQVKPYLIVNAAAYTDVDRAESEPARANLINAESPGVLAETSRKLHIPLIHYSTDFVYDGEKTSPYLESDTPHPINVYGASKLQGDIHIQQSADAYLILRTSWVFSNRKGGFVSKVLAWAQSQPVLRIVTDQVGSPTWARTLAQITAQLVTRSQGYAWFKTHRGVYHIAGLGAASRYEWTQAILEFTSLSSSRLEPALTRDFKTTATRPSFSALDCSFFTRKFRIHIPPWRESLVLCLTEKPG